MSLARPDAAGEPFPPHAPPPASPPAATRVTTRIELPTRTILKVLITLGVLWFLGQIFSILLQIFVAAILAAALQPAVVRLERRGIPRLGAIGLVILTLVGALALVLFLLIPPLIDEGTEFAENLPVYIQEAEGLLRRNEELYERIRSSADSGAANPSSLLGGFLTVGQGVVTGISNAFIVIVLAVYILVDGKGIFRWLARDLPAGQRAKVQAAVPQLIQVISGYVAGQALTSALFGIFSFAVLSALGVPQALLLAIVAAFADAIPIAGILIATVPATLLAATESLTAAVVVFVAYIAYQQVENYVIVPRVYRSTLQISSFAVLVAVLIGGKLLGILGVLLALPVAAAIPVIERVWMGDLAESYEDVVQGRDTLPPLAGEGRATGFSGGTPEG